MITRIHINKHRMRAGKACIGIEQAGRRKRYRRQVLIQGPSLVIYSPDKPLKCGAKAWIETDAGVW